MGYLHIPVKPETKKLVDGCKDEFLLHHPELKGMVISYDKILSKIAKYYLDN